MVFLIINIITLLNTNNPIDGNLLGKHISELDIALVEEIDSITNKKSFRVKENIDFLGKQFDHVSIRTSLNDTIESIYIGCRGTIEEKGFLSAMISEYGEPKMYKNDVIKEIKQHLPDKNGISATTFKASMKECAFIEEPLFIIWHNEKYIIKLNISVKSRTSITFKKKLNKILLII
ncbi:hypothetical protein AWE51_22040 [Aquimarina aggregata]|uniref:Uncharacterized protein n=1 Tax=Aquimarina aggregata TaxID=1642818 RepID=A0A163BGZ5_9FLAO|nr:hypothetical protein [Aquimarina aggregata]KZS41387.1 hypothetical protein AWE51_22040 [Aquimarina aggregata]